MPVSAGGRMAGWNGWEYAVWLEIRGPTYVLGRISATPSRQVAKFKESMMGRWPFSVVAAIAILVSGPASLAQGFISKRYVLDRGQSDDVSHVIDSAVPSPSNVNWPDLRRRLLKTNVPTDGFMISRVEGRVSVKDDSPRPIIHVWTSGDPIEWKINDGQIIDVSAKANGDAVLLTFRGIDNERTTVYRSIEDQLVVEATITSPGLLAPIHYKLVYN